MDQSDERSVSDFIRSLMPKATEAELGMTQERLADCIGYPHADA